MSSWPTVDEVRAWIGNVDAGDAAEANLQACLAAAVGWLTENTSIAVTDDVPAPVWQACRLMTARLYDRKNSPGGVQQLGDTAIRLYAVDHDVWTLIGPYRPVLLK